MSAADGGSGGASPLLSIKGLSVEFRTRRGVVRGVDDVTLDIHRGETLALVGESGSGKSVTSLSIMRLIDDRVGRISSGSVVLRLVDGRLVNLASLNEAELRDIRGNHVAMVFQEPMTSLDPVYPVGKQVAEAIRIHQGKSKSEAARAAAEMLRRVGIPDPERRANDFPHQMSGGMRQRVMIAMALSCRPALLIADEPTTALDVTIQAQILDLIRALHAELDMAVLFITHNLGIVAEFANRVAVMYAGQIVEEAKVEEIFDQPLHPYTAGLLRSIPRVDPSREHAPGARRARLYAIEGAVPDPANLPPGCAFSNRCPFVAEVCTASRPDLVRVASTRSVRCHRWREVRP